MSTTISVYCENSGKTEFKRPVMIDSSISSRYKGSVLIDVFDCDDLSFIHDAVCNCQPVSINHGLYESWVKSMISFKSGKIDKITLECTPFYKDGQTLDFQVKKSQQDRLQIPPNGGNTDGIIKKVTFDHMFGQQASNIYIFYEKATTDDFLLDSELGGYGTTTIDAYALNGSYQGGLVNFPTSNTVLSVGNYVLQESLRKTLSTPRNVVYSMWPPSPSHGVLLHKLQAVSQSIYTSWHTVGLPIAYTASLGNVEVLNMTITVGNASVPLAAFFNYDFIGFYPLSFMSAVNVPFNFADSRIEYYRKFNKTVSKSQGKEYAVKGDLLLNPYLGTSLYIVSSAPSTPLARHYYRLQVETSEAYRMTCERLP